MNPILIIPMILTTLAGLGIGALATQIGIMAHTYVLIPWTTPPVISAFLATGGDIMSGVIGSTYFGSTVLIYIPFVKVMNKEGIESMKNKLLFLILVRYTLGANNEIIGGTETLNCLDSLQQMGWTLAICTGRLDHDIFKNRRTIQT